MNPERTGTVVFGGFDGLTSALGVVAAGLAAGGAIARPAAGLAAAAAVSMAGGEFLADNQNGMGEAAAMGVATLIGSFLPAAPYLMFPRHPATVVSLIVTVLAAVTIAEIRLRSAVASWKSWTAPWGHPDQPKPREPRRISAYGATFGLLIVAAAAAVMVALLLGAGG